eukprot:TRINITY_DN1582_c0_g1_i2.p1 TRINITY_DN1582_c0_g1~~TRINITY_DN1582_c0_g1_i2.p1  ORF type:complete len:106 (+),score=20.79 TRINITY_DN1582_c0_g1_i2:235-552(+)
MATRQARRRLFTLTVTIAVIVLMYMGGFFDYEIHRETSVAALSPEQLRDRGDFNAWFEKAMKDIVGKPVTKAILKVYKKREKKRIFSYCSCGRKKRKKEQKLNSL